MTVPDSPVAAAFVAAPNHWSRDGKAIRAIVAHMAEGSGTVAWLTRDDGNSSHYVVETAGRVVQMVPESRAAGSMNPRLTRTGDDPPFTYLGESVTYGRRALDAAGISDDPNAYAIAIEVEGFAATGPNDRQRAALARLVADIRRRRGALPVLGHRDQQSYKAYPGKRIPWADWGGHGRRTAVTPGPPSAEETVNSYPVPTVPSVATVTAGRWLYGTSALKPSPDNICVDPGCDMPYLGQPTSAVRIVEYVDAKGIHQGRGMFAKASEETAIRPAPDPSPFSQAQLDIAAKTAAGAVKLAADRTAAAYGA